MLKKGSSLAAVLAAKENCQSEGKIVKQAGEKHSVLIECGGLIAARLGWDLPSGGWIAMRFACIFCGGWIAMGLSISQAEDLYRGMWWLDSHENCFTCVWWLHSHENCFKLWGGWIAMNMVSSLCGGWIAMG